MKLSKRLVVLTLLPLSWAPLGFAQATAPPTTAPLDLNPATNCMEALFEATLPEAQRLVPAPAVVEALRGGHCLRLQHAVVQGDLDLRVLPINGVAASGATQITLKGAFVVIESRFEGKLTAAAVTGGPSLRFDGPAVFRGTRFGALDFSGARFSDAADFSEARFDDNVKFDRIQFERDATFAGAAFGKPVFLTGIRVRGTLDLSGTTFASLLRAFGIRADEISLDGARFSTTTDATGWQARVMSARGAEFNQAVDFTNGNWQQRARFGETTFSGNADFSGVRFGEMETDFQRSTFAKNATFAQARFPGPADFDAARFSLTASFHEAVFFDGALFHGAVFEALARFTKTRFLGWVDFRGVDFVDLDLEQAVFLSPAPNWDGAAIHGTVLADGLSSHTPWPLEQPPLREALGQGTYLLNHAEKTQLKRTQTVHLVLLGALGAGMALLAFLMLK